MSQPSWVITPEGLRACLGKVVLVDVREPEEHAESRIESCTLIPLGELKLRAPLELQDKSADIVVYCAHGVRSMQGVMALQSMGYQKLRSLDGGICAWEEYLASINLATS